MRNQSGSSLIEVMVMLAITMTIFYTFGEGISFVSRSSKAGLVGSAGDRKVNQMVESIKKSMENYQVNFNTTEVLDNREVDRILAEARLPMAWSAERTCALGTPECSDALPGRYGFLIQPYEQFRGLYRVTLRLTHKEWKAVGEGYREFSFVVSAK